MRLMSLSALVLFCLSASAQEGDKTTIEWKLKKGDQHRYEAGQVMEINIGGFRSMVDAIGGIDITQDVALYDSKLNFKLPAGTSHLDGNQALSFVRARYATPDGDFGRIRRQQQPSSRW